MTKPNPSRDDRGAAAREAAKTERAKSSKPLVSVFERLLSFLTSLSPKK